MELLLDILKWSVIVGAAALALTLLKPLLDKRYSAKWRYGVWLVMAAFLLLAPVRWDVLLPETPVTPPVVLAATSNRSETPICCAAVACSAANRALDDVSDPVRNTPSQPRNGEKKVNA